MNTLKELEKIKNQKLIEWQNAEKNFNSKINNIKEDKICLTGTPDKPSVKIGKNLSDLLRFKGYNEFKNSYVKGVHSLIFSKEPNILNVKENSFNNSRSIIINGLDYYNYFTRIGYKLNEPKKVRVQVVDRDDDHFIRIFL